MTKKVISIVGARPQFIKLGPFSSKLRRYFKEIIIHTGQHYDKNMSDLLFKDLEIPTPDYNLNIGSGNQGYQTGRMLESIEEILINEKPDLVVVFGDTNSTMAGALSAAKLCIPTVHVEAGLRSFNRSMPEEINRIVADHTADVLLAPTETAMKNLKDEGLIRKSFLSGDIMVDALKENLSKALEISDVEDTYKITENSFYLTTLHRPYNVDNPDNLSAIMNGFANLDANVLFPVHPRTRKILEASNIKASDNVILIEPQGYLDFLKLQYLSKKIVTDSGGIQKEAYLLKKPCITLRPETEWTETVEQGWNILLDYKNPDFYKAIIDFNPKTEPAPVFGTDVAGKMIEIVRNLS